MVSHREGKKVIVCDGCHKVIGEADPLPKAGKFILKEGEAEGPVAIKTKGGYADACDDECAQRYTNRLIKGARG